MTRSPAESYLDLHTPAIHERAALLGFQNGELQKLEELQKLKKKVTDQTPDTRPFPFTHLIFRVA